MSFSKLTAACDPSQATTDAEFVMMANKIRHQYFAQFQANAVRFRPGQNEAIEVQKKVAAVLNSVAYVSNPNKYADVAVSPSFDAGLAAQIDKLAPSLSKKWSSCSAGTRANIKIGVLAGLTATVSVLILCLKQKRSLSDTIAEVVKIGGAAAALAPALVWVIKALGKRAGVWMKEPLKAVLLAVGLEATEEGVKQFILGGIGASIGVLTDVVAFLFSKGIPRSAADLWVFVQAIGDSLLCNVVLGIGGAAVAASCPALLTIVIMGVVGAVFGMLRQRVRDVEGTSIVAALGTGLIGIPMALVRTFFPAPQVAHPDSMCCQISMDLLDDPVFFRGYYVSRAAAQAQAIKGVDFWNAPAGPGDIVPMIEMRRLVDRYKAIKGM